MCGCRYIYEQYKIILFVEQMSLLFKHAQITNSLNGGKKHAKFALFLKMKLSTISRFLIKG